MPEYLEFMKRNKDNLVKGKKLLTVSYNVTAKITKLPEDEEVQFLEFDYEALNRIFSVPDLGGLLENALRAIWLKKYSAII